MIIPEPNLDFLPIPDLGSWNHGSKRPQHCVLVGYFSMFRFILEQPTPEILSKTFGIPPFLRHGVAACPSRRESQRSSASRIFTTSTPPSRPGNPCLHHLLFFHQSFKFSDFLSLKMHPSYGTVQWSIQDGKTKQFDKLTLL
jgi:hypothetical protein